MGLKSKNLIKLKVKIKIDPEKDFVNPLPEKKAKNSHKTGKMAIFPPKLGCKVSNTTGLTKFVDEKTVLAIFMLYFG